MSQRYARRNEKGTHTESKIEMPVCIASAGGKDYQICIRVVEHPTSGLRHTMPIAWPMVAVAETLERTDTTLLSDLVILSFPRKSVNACACSWRRAVTESTDWQFWSRSASGWLAKGMSVCFS
jgi:hypothetical protein